MVNINFQPDASAVPSGYIKDIGAAYSDARGFGWVQEDSLNTAIHTPLDIKSNSRDRNRAGIDQPLDTLLSMQYPAAIANNTAVKIPAAWEYAVTNGNYSVTVSVGDAPNSGGVYDSQHTINVEGVNAINGFQGSASQEYKQATLLVNVEDGKLTVDAIGGTNTKINYIHISSLTSPPPTISSSRATSAPEIEIKNLDGVPYPDLLVFSRIGSLTNPPDNGVSDVATLRIENTGSGSLQIAGLPITGPWELANTVNLPTTIGPGGQLDLPVRFKATSGDIHNGTLTINSNDSDEPNTVVQLSGFWQSVSEKGQEPKLNELLEVFGYATVLTEPGQQLNNKGVVEAVGEEVLSPYWLQADESKPVTVSQLAAYHTQGPTATVYWYNEGSNTTSKIFNHANSDGQTVLPSKDGSVTQIAQGTFNPSSTFGFKIDNAWSDPTKNKQTDGSSEPSGHLVRFWPARNQQGERIPNTWLMTMDYLGINYDYNDNVYLISNIKPESPTALYRLDVGSNSDYTDSSGKIWSKDTGLFTPSTAIAENGGAVDIANTNDDILYQTYRGNVGDSTPLESRILNYNLPISKSEQLEVRLHFAELYWGGPGGGAAGTGKRIFDVIAEGETVLNDFDITAASGGALKATVVSIPNIEVNDGTLNLAFKAEKNFAAISAIEVLRI